MKKQICTAIIASAVSMPSMAMLDFDVYTGIDYRTTDNSQSYSGVDQGLKDTNNLSGYLAIEHFIPMLPNAKLKYSDLSTETSTSSTTIKGSAANAILYYQLFDNSLFDFDLGLAYTRLESDIDNMSENLGQAYAAAKLQIPGTGVHVFAELISGSLSSDTATDAELGLAYTFNPDSILNLAVRAGYRYQDAEFNDLEIENKGLFVGLELHF
ncbi:MAG: outer membrane protein [Psychromonas sp.]|jgi:outer membrane protein|uniref:TIGR04219 family outer membrane beta-barrel protein n=1 Tax=Psychromonas sp. TaxID=1884585 RepID=UPI0039E5ECC9